ncbi:MAG: hypothetical protein ACPGOY_18485 [Rhodospirillaceae bacterium]
MVDKVSTRIQDAPIIRDRAWEFLVPEDWVASDGQLWKNMSTTQRQLEAWNNRGLRKILPRWWRDRRAEDFRRMRVSGAKPLLIRKSRLGLSDEQILNRRLSDLPPGADEDYRGLETTLADLKGKKGPLSPEDQQTLAALEQDFADFWDKWKQIIEIEKQKVRDHYEKWKQHEERMKQKDKKNA